MSIFRKICPICALVFLAWATMLALKWRGYAVDEALLAILMGGSAVGITHALGAKLALRGAPAAWWKLVAIPTGFAAMYALLRFAWWIAASLIVAYGIAWFLWKEIASTTMNAGRIDLITKTLDDTCCD